MKLNSKNLVLNLLGTDSNIQVNKKVLLTLGLEEAFFLSYLIDQYKYLEREEKLREDGSFYASNMDIALYTTLNNSQISKIKRAGVEKNLFKISKEGLETKTYYYLNFDKILEIIGTEKSNLELAYNNIFKNNENELSIETEEDIINLNKFSVKELRLMCKENQIKYTGVDNKKSLINKIIEFKNPVLFKVITNNDFFTVDVIASTSGQEVRPLTKNELLSYSSGQEIRPLVDEFSVTNHDIIKPRINTCHVRDHEIENLFKELEINYTDTNVESTNIILRKLNNDKELLKEYIVNFYHQVISTAFNIQNKSAFFSSKLKEPNELLIKKLLSKQQSEIEKKKKEEEKLKFEEEERKKTKEMERINVETDLILAKLNSFSIEDKRKIITKAENKIESIESKESLNFIKEALGMEGTLYLRRISKEIKMVLNEEGLL
ncbi:MAG: hypothetical protein SOY60_05095 [Fusobacterium gastrosuis]|uniref:hypothetical protein n=1 Tax=Fusobacterium gastrosuis TaxID=1755100 RepID=UPI002974F019|nr:hypothetical protein [Fusobacteriaceae bacterium]MDY4011022.1 hypothetical protein [Fusobacterium gastrosuis]MDY5713526.1 hypothetical protein [Fusobacterium gastrosuis]